MTIAEVQKLLGPNLAGLKVEEGNSPVRDWLLQQQQDDLDSLGLGLHGGIPNGYLVLDLNVRGGLGWPACGEAEGAGVGLSGVEGLNHSLSSQRPSLGALTSLDLRSWLWSQLCSWL